MRQARRCTSSRKEDIMGSRAMDHKDSPGTIRKDRGTGRREVIMMTGGADQVDLWRQCWLVWHVVVAWMLVCYFKRLEKLALCKRRGDRGIVQI